MLLKEASYVYNELRTISAQILKALGMDTEPHRPVVRTRPFRNKRYQGIIYHYTGGPSGEKSMRWCNDPSWNNTSSSWHVTIFDRVEGEVGRLWMELADAALRRLFPVPTIIMADWRWGTWHGNWCNDVTLGVENRNVGCNHPELISKLGKKGVTLQNKTWEPFTREQIIANVNIGRVADGWIDNQLDRAWVLPHMAIWASKSDPGPLFPIYSVRNAIFDNSDLRENAWITSKFAAAPTISAVDEPWIAPIDSRDDPFVKWETSKPFNVATLTDAEISSAMGIFGFDCSYVVYDSNKLIDFVKWFQRSTAAYADPKGYNKPEWVLSPDGVAGPKTKEAIIRRFKQLGIKS